jgi:hypothetical protein
MTKTTQEQIEAAKELITSYKLLLTNTELGEPKNADGSVTMPPWLRDCRKHLDHEKTIKAALSVLQKIARGDDWFEIDGECPAPRDENGEQIILGKHRIWGAMDIRYKPQIFDGRKFTWMNGDYICCWPDEAIIGWKPIDGETHIKMLLEQEMKGMNDE